MLCPMCRSASTESSWRSWVRRGGRSIRIDARCWQCTSCRTSMDPFKFRTPEQDDENDLRAAQVWRDTFHEEIPPALPGVRLRKLMRTEAGRVQVARAFGKVLSTEIENRKLKP